MGDKLVGLSDFTPLQIIGAIIIIALIVKIFSGKSGGNNSGSGSGSKGE